ncbi:hypothetical protein GCM10011519_01610 [Marmoricola endophyticus]|uniref:Uncharacterized protein n=1 Tax=Marmoricola endophyticus TaxID=2040280 RepID=A0A917B8S9_9ACTN|nr:hypothetical protein GCM10011519_01610 [Marmoricola endophyticus]
MHGRSYPLGGQPERDRRSDEDGDVGRTVHAVVGVRPPLQPPRRLPEPGDRVPAPRVAERAVGGVPQYETDRSTAAGSTAGARHGRRRGRMAG